MADDADRAAQIQADEIDRAIQRQQQRDMRHQRRDVAGRILCLDCGERIEQARLAANPAALRCVWCQREQERKEFMTWRNG